MNLIYELNHPSLNDFSSFWDAVEFLSISVNVGSKLIFYVENLNKNENINRVELNHWQTGVINT